jgi:glycosyltransferase involved in cell wall biosynthesis
MDVTAILAIRNEETYLANCLRHLVRNGVNFVVLDNESYDSSAAIYSRHEFSANLVEVRTIPYRGQFSLSEQLRVKTQVAESTDADWFIHLDADEIMHSYREGETLNETLHRLDAEGWNVANFDEFVFLPIDADYTPDAPRHQPMSLYYFFEPHAPRLMRAWRKGTALLNERAGGHLLTGASIRMAPEHLALRHYIVRDQAHAFRKYRERQFAAEDINRGWHLARMGQPEQAFLLPDVGRLKRLSAPDRRDLDRSEPWSMHFWGRTESGQPGHGGMSHVG